MDTKGIICRALQTELKRKRMDNVTVQNILDEAHIARSTFYRHFADKFDLMVWYYRAWLDALPDSDNIHMHFQNLSASMTFISENKTYFQKVLCTTESTALEQLIFDHSYDYYCMIYKKYLGAESLTTKSIFKIRFICHGSTGIACEWIRNGCKEPPELISRVITEMVPDELKRFYLGD